MDDEREEECAAEPVPAGLSAEVAGYRWARDRVGKSDGAVYRLFGKLGAPDLFLKRGGHDLVDEITGEMVRMRWLVRHLPTPVVVQFVTGPDDARLLMTASGGETAYQLSQARPDARTAIVDVLAIFLRRFAIPPGDCPFNSDHIHRLTCARARIDAGLVKDGDFDDAREG